ncbi:MAG: 30S ribosomal protein S10 [Cyanobacteriota bacterium]
MAEQKIRIKLKSYDHKALDEASRKIVETATRAGAKVTGPIPLPVRRNLYCVLKSPHSDKKSREHFEFNTHKRLIDIIDPSQKTIESLTRIDLAAGVDIELKM